MTATIQRRTQALRQQRPFPQPILHRQSVIAPVLGWNKRDPLAAMKPGYATVLDNLIPDLGEIRMRKGSTLYHQLTEGTGQAQTNVSGNVETLMPLIAGGRTVLWAAAGGSLYEVQDPGEASVATVRRATGLNGNRWQFAAFRDSLLAANGEDQVRRLQPDGTVVIPGHTGVDLSTLSTVAVWKNRVLFGQKDTPNLWYSRVREVAGGVLEPFPLDGVHQAGGSVVALGTLTLDKSVGVDDILVIFMSSGAVLMYAGTDISVADQLDFIGRFDTGRVVDPRGVFQEGSDLVAVTTEGYVSMKALLSRNPDTKQYDDKIAPESSRVGSEAADEDGWAAMRWPESNLLIINVPDPRTGTVQHVRNLRTGAWCRFRGWNPLCFASYRGLGLYGAPGGRIVRMLHGDTDLDLEGSGNKNILAFARTSYSTFRSGLEKLFQEVRPHVAVQGKVVLEAGVSVDYTDRRTPGTEISVSGGGSRWNVTPWNTAQWGGGLTHLREWVNVEEQGTSAAVTLSVANPVVDLRWFSTDIIYKHMKGRN